MLKTFNVLKCWKSTHVFMNSLQFISLVKYLKYDNTYLFINLCAQKASQI